MSFRLSAISGLVRASVHVRGFLQRISRTLCTSGRDHPERWETDHMPDVRPRGKSLISHHVLKLVHKLRNFISNQSSDQHALESELLSFYYTLEQPNKIRRYQRFESATPFEQRRAVRAGVEADDRGRWAVRGIRRCTET